ncbi:MAG: hypothetical protein ACT4P6_17950 [Gemmatimonadaceae bacterium]
MNHIDRSVRRVGSLLAFSGALLSPSTEAQTQERKGERRDTVVTASTYYSAGPIHRWLLGDNWRDIWATPIKVPFLDLRTFAGGLKPVDTGGSAQTTSLRFVGADGKKYAFRPVYKERLVHLKEFENTIIADIFRDGLSSLHPTGPLAAPSFLRAAGIIHPEPTLFVMPDDPALGEFRKEFAGRLGAIEDRAMMPENGAGLGGATELIDSEDLLKKINKSPNEHIDARTYLKARLIDILLNDYDRHLNQWRWALIPPRLAGSVANGDAIEWVPIPRDRDAAFINHEGASMPLARVVKPNLVAFEADFPNMRAFAGAVIDLDQRLLVGLDKTVWDSMTTWLKTTITDAVIDSAVWAMPHEYLPLHGELHAKLKSRRDKLHRAANEYYRVLAQIAEIHAPDTDDSATVVREGSDVIVRIKTGDGRPWFERRFKPGETREIRLYLHGGNDLGLVTGDGTSPIFVRVVGGNGSNSLYDNSRGGRSRLTRFYDRGTVSDIVYGKDTVFNRRPWVEAYGKPVPPLKDRGSRAGPTFGFRSGSGLGVVSKLGYERRTYGFRYMPYKDRMALDVEYASGVQGYRVQLDADRRIQNERWHYMMEGLISELEIVEFRGVGNAVEDSDDPFFNVHQRQWVFRPAIGFAWGPEGDISLGPIVKYVTTDSLPNNFISRDRPLGFPRFGQAGLQLRAEQEKHDSLLTRGFTLEASASYYPQVWDVESGFGEVSALAKTYLTLPFLTRPTLALRGGVKRLFGDAPYYEAAFIGGRRSVRVLQRQRFAGDLAVHGTSELRVPLLRFNYFLPWSVGAIGFVEGGRVYNNGESANGWHQAQGYGGWIGLLSQKYSIQVLRTNNPERRLIIGTGFAF